MNWGGDVQTKRETVSTYLSRESRANLNLTCSCTVDPTLRVPASVAAARESPSSMARFRCFFLLVGTTAICAKAVSAVDENENVRSAGRELDQSRIPQRLVDDDYSSFDDNDDSFLRRLDSEDDDDDDDEDSSPAFSPTISGCACQVTNQHSTTSCVEGYSFECAADYSTMTVSAGCRADFKCGDAMVLCESYHQVTQTCDCQPSTCTAPSPVPISAPTAVPLPAPTAVPVPAPTAVPFPAPTAVPTPAPTAMLIPAPTAVPIPVSTAVPFPAPTIAPLPTPDVVARSSLRVRIEGIPEIVEPQSRIELAAVLATETMTTVHWSSPDIDVTDASKFSTLSDSLWLVVRPNVLSPGRFYTFSIHAASVDGTMIGHQDAVANVTVKTNIPPAGGTMEVTPTRGVAFQTAFLLTSDGWFDADDGDAVLSHRFGYYSPAARSWIFLAAGNSTLSASSIARSSLPLGNQSITVNVTDSLGGQGTSTVSHVYAKISNQTEGSACAAALEVLPNIQISTLIKSRDGVGALAKIAASAETLNAFASSCESSDEKESFSKACMRLLADARNASGAVEEVDANSITLSADALHLITMALVHPDDNTGVEVAMFARDVVNASRPLQSINGNARVSIVAALALLPVTTPKLATLVSDVLLQLHLLASIAPGEEELVTAGASLALSSQKLPPCSRIMGCNSITLQSPRPASADANSSLASFELTKETLAEISLVLNATGSGGFIHDIVGVPIVTWTTNPWQTNITSASEFYVPADILQNSSVFSVSFTARQQVLSVSNLSSPIKLSLPLRRSTFLDAANETLCLYWDTAQNKWSSSGIQMLNHTRRTASCETTHATDFVAVRGFRAARRNFMSYDDFHFRKVRVVLGLTLFIYAFAGFVALRDFHTTCAFEKKRALETWKSPAFHASLKWLAMPRTGRFAPAEDPMSTANLNETERTAALAQLRRASNPSARKLIRKFKRASLEHHKVLAMLQGFVPSLARSPVVLLDLLTFFFAVTVLNSVFGDDDNIEIYMLWTQAESEGPIGLIYSYGTEILNQTLCLALIALIPRSILGAALGRYHAQRTVRDLWERKVSVDGLLCLGEEVSHSAIDVRRAVLGVEAAQRLVERFEKRVMAHATRPSQLMRMPTARSEHARVVGAKQALAQYAEELIDLKRETKQSSDDGKQSSWRSSGGLLQPVANDRSETEKRKDHAFDMVFLGALPREELQETLRGHYLTTALPRWWQRWMYQLFLLEKNERVSTVQPTWSLAASLVLVVFCSLYLLAITLFIIGFHLSQSTSNEVSRNKAVYAIATANMVIDLVLVTPLLILFRSVLIPLIVSRILQGPLAKVEQQLVNSNMKVRNVASVLDAKRAENEKQAKNRAPGVDANRSSIRQASAWLARKSKSIRRTPNIELGEVQSSGGSRDTDSSDAWLESARAAQSTRCAEGTSEEPAPARLSRWASTLTKSKKDPVAEKISITANPLAASRTQAKR